MTDLKIFENKEFGRVRTVTVNNEPYFVGKDVTDILGYKNGSRDINRHVDDEDRLEVMLPQYQNSTLVSKAIIINESGLYSLIISSKMPKAKQFKRWVTSEVLPSIRKHGGYLTPEKIEEVLLNPDTLIQLAKNLKAEQEKRKQLEIEVAVNNQVIQELQPKASYYDVVLNCKDLISTSKIAKDYGLSAVKLNSLLHDFKVQYKQGDIWLLYQKYAEKGYTNTKTHIYNKTNGTQGTSVHTYWTQKGRLFIYDLLKSKGITPLMERKSA